MTTALEKTFEAYVTCALWSSNDDNDNPLDDSMSVDDLSAATAAQMLEDCKNFLDANAALLDESGLSFEQIGYDFWFTRNRHGTGFWDRGLGKVGESLTDAAKACGEVAIYVGDDGLIRQGL
jgi:hypothetical protein